jgi:broad specificity phosphatase PhoE
MTGMGTLYLVRHGQASFGSQDYDRLSELGERQCGALGAWMAARGLRFEGVMRGSLRRHRQSLQAMAAHLPDLPPAVEWPGLDEYDSEALIRSVPGDAWPAARDADSARQHFRLLREGLLRWMAGAAQPAGMPAWSEFLAGVSAALDEVRSRYRGDVLLVSSGGPIATAVGHVLGAPAPAVVELNMRIRNSAVTEFVFTPKRHALLGFNALPHLDQLQHASWVTYA